MKSFTVHSCTFEGHIRPTTSINETGHEKAGESSKNSYKMSLGYKELSCEGRIKRYRHVVACKGGCGGATAPGIQPVGHPKTEFSSNSVGKCLKKEKKGSAPGIQDKGGIRKKFV